MFLAFLFLSDLPAGFPEKLQRATHRSCPNISFGGCFFPHCSAPRRDPFEVYTSPSIVNTTAGDKFILTVAGRFNRRQYVEPAILLEGAGLAGSGAPPVPLAQSASRVSYRVSIPAGATFRYQLKLNSSHSGGGPIVSAVRLETMEGN